MKNNSSTKECKRVLFGVADDFEGGFDVGGVWVGGVEEGASVSHLVFPGGGGAGAEAVPCATKEVGVGFGADDAGGIGDHDDDASSVEAIAEEVAGESWDGAASDVVSGDGGEVALQNCSPQAAQTRQ